MKATIDMSAAVAEARLARYQEQSRLVKRGMKLKTEAGGTVGRAPLGYVNKRMGKEAWVELDPATAPIVRAAFGLLDEGLSLRATLKHLEAEKVSPQQRLAPSSLHEIVKNPFYAGLIRQGEQLRQGKHEALVEPDMYWRVQGRLEERRKSPRS
jgi:site-specific DNA recombinase